VTPAYQILEILEGDQLLEIRREEVKKALEVQKERGTATFD
jgi:hypothetical protein